MQSVNKTRGVGPLGGSGVVAQWGASSIVKSVQRGRTTSSNNGFTATITSVDTNNSVVSYLKETNTTGYGNNDQQNRSRVTLTNATTLTFDRYVAGGVSQTVSWEVIEFIPGILKSVQYATCGVNAGVGITQVNTGKTLLIQNGFSQYCGATEQTPYGYLSSSTAITCTSASPGDGSTLDIQGGNYRWAVLEFY
jgi:hypothetical protein